MKARIFFALTTLAIVVYGNACSNSFNNELPAELAPAYGFYRQLGAVTKPSGGMTNNNEDCAAVALDSQGNIFCAGRTSGSLAAPNAGAEDLFVLKFNPSGVLEWAIQLGGSGTEGCNGLALDNNDDVFCAGTTTSNLDGNSAVLASDAFILKLDGATGALLWINQFNNVAPKQTAVDNTGVDRCLDVSVDKYANVYCVGDTTGSLFETKAGVGTNAIVVKLNATTGAKIWAKQFGSLSLAALSGVNGSESCAKAHIDASGNLFCAGTTGGDFIEAFGGGGTDAFVMKLAAIDGDVLWAKQFGNLSIKAGGSNAGDEEAMGITTDSHGDAYVSLTTTGNMAELGDSKDIVVAKLTDATSGRLEWMTQLGQATTWKDGTNSGVDSCAVGVNAKDEIFCAGNTTSDMGELHAGISPDAVIMKFTSKGKLEWLRQWGRNTKGSGKDNAGSEQLVSIAFTDDDGLVAAGSSSGGFAEANGGGRDVLLIKMKTTGQLPP